MEITKPKNGKLYKKVLARIKKQFNSAETLTRAFINSDGVLYAAEWIDKNGVINFNSGYVPDIHKILVFK